MAAHGNARPIIKRRKVINGGGHHGGAWKVAYADFVTAMMAFFMLMWLLGATTEKQRKGIADYFNPTIPLHRISGGGEGAFGGDSVFSEDTMAQSGTGAGLVRPTEERQAKGALGTGAQSGEGRGEDDALREVEKALLAFSGESLIEDMIRRHIVTRISDEGLVIEIFEREDARLFLPATANPSGTLSALIPAVTQALGLVVNGISVEAHVQAVPVVQVANRPWALSVSRADALRGLLEDGGLPASRITRITGHGDKVPIASNPMALRNSRVEIVVLRNLP